MKTPPKYLLEALEAKEGVLFIGSGVSQWSGLPSWDGLLLRMLAFLDDRGLAAHERAEIDSVIGTGDLLTAASLCSARRRKAIFAFRCWDRKPYKTAGVVDSLFGLLREPEDGHYAADYLVQITDEAIVERASQKLQEPRRARSKRLMPRLLRFPTLRIASMSLFAQPWLTR
jgi:hypothetical protein